jgi:WD40 repeat protein
VQRGGGRGAGGCEPRVTTRKRAGRREFVAIATTEYHSSFPELPGVKKEVEAIAGWLTNEQLGDRRLAPILSQLSDNPDEDQIRVAFKNAATRVPWAYGDAAVVYITGHGVTKTFRANSQGYRRTVHYLALSETRKSDLPGTGFATADLFDWLAGLDIEHLLVIIDACFAGQVMEQVDGLASDKEHWLILPSATKGQQAMVFALTDAINEFIEDAKKYNTEDPYFRVGMFVDTLNGLLGPTQRVDHIYKGGEHDEHRCLPNPAYRPGNQVDTAGSLRALALSEDALRLHHRHGGDVLGPDEVPGWLLTGRVRLMQDLIRGASAAGVTMVTGSAGCGKSAALARLVTLSDEDFRAQHADELAAVPGDLLPQVGAVHLALTAREKSSEDILALICHYLDLRIPRRRRKGDLTAYMQALSDYLAAQPLTIVIDALDEAREAASLIRGVLAPLRRVHRDQLCLLIGVRSPGGDTVAPPDAAMADESPDVQPLADLVAAELAPEWILQVDREPWWLQNDVGAFVRDRLTNRPRSPYRKQAGAIDEIIRAIGAMAGPSYLYAKVAADSLARRPDVIAPDDPAWRSALDAGLLGVFQDDLQVSVPSRARRRDGVTLLRAVAFARGSGMPWTQVWPAVATAVAASDGANFSYGDRDVEWLLASRLNAYLERDRQDDLTVYRLPHDELRQTLRYQWRRLLAESRPEGEAGNDMPAAGEAEIAAVEEQIALRLSPTLRASVAVDQAISPYVRRHLAEHALAGGVLAEAVPIRFLPYLDLGRLRAVLGTMPDRRQLEEEVTWLPVLRQVTHLWDWGHPARNAAAIEMWTALTGATLSGKVGGPWRVDWAVGPPDNGSVLGKHDGEVSVAAVADLAETPVAVTGGADGKLHIWDLGKGALYREPVDTGAGIRSVTTSYLPDGRAVAVTGGADGTIRTWDLRTGREAVTPWPAGRAAVVALTVGALPGERLVVVTADTANTIRAWDLTSGEPIGRPVNTEPGKALGLAVARVGDQVLGLATGEDSGLLIWDLATGDRIGDRLDSHHAQIRSTTRTIPGGRAIATAVLDGREVAITGNGNGLLFWDLRDRVAVRERLAGNDGKVRSLAVIQRKNGRFIGVTGGNSAVRVWDLTAGEPTDELLNGHDGSVEAVAVIESADGTLAVSASWDATVRAWEIAGDRLSAAQPSAEQVRTVNAVATATLRGRPVAITCSHSVVQVRDLDDGRLLLPPLTGHTSTVVSVSAAELPDGGVLIVAGAWDGTVCAWSAADGTTVGAPASVHQGAIASLATARLANGRIVAVTGGWDHTVRVWDPYQGAPVGPPLRPHAGTVVAVATARDADGHLLAVSGSSDGHVYVRDIDSYVDSSLPGRAEPADIDVSRQLSALIVTELPDGRTGVVAGTEDGMVHVLDPWHSPVPGQSWRACAQAVTALAAMRLDDGRVAVFSGGLESLVQAWDISTGQPISEALPVPGPVRVMACHPQPSRLVIGGAGAVVAHPRFGAQ